jgi:Rrf2 family protein
MQSQKDPKEHRAIAVRLLCSHHHANPYLDNLYPDKIYPLKESRVQFSKGVEWSSHVCTILAMLPEGKGFSTDALAEFFELPSAYLAKQMQLLRRADIVKSVRGKGGGYRLARSVDQISLLDIVRAIEGPMPAFRCSEIRQNGPCALKRSACKRPCEVAAAFAAAEAVYFEALGNKTLAMIMTEAAMNSAPEHMMNIANWTSRQIQ